MLGKMFFKFIRFLFFKNVIISGFAFTLLLAVIGPLLMGILNYNIKYSNSYVYWAFWVLWVGLIIDSITNALGAAALRSFFGFVWASAMLGFIIFAGITTAQAGAPGIIAVVYPLLAGGILFLCIAITEIPVFLSSATEHPIFRQWFTFGHGGNARWAGPSSLRARSAEPKKRDGIFLGKTLIQDSGERWSVGIPGSDDAHHVTIAATGSGKSVTALWTNIRQYPGPMIILDPKGEHAAFSAKSRDSLSYILDPYRKTAGEDLSDLYANYNPLDDIDIHAPGARGYLEAISDGCVLKEEKDKHFSENAKTVIEGVIAHVLSRHPQQDRNLPFIANLFRGFDADLGFADPAGFDAVIAEMSTNNAAGGVPMDAASILLKAGDRERGSILTTCFRSLKWVTDPPMSKQLMGGTPDVLNHIVNWNAKRSLFIVLPFEYMEESSQIRWMRVLINMVGVYLFRHPRDRDGQPKLVMVLDEFFKLGYMSKLEEGIVTARGAGMKYWILVQDIGQLKKLYGETWETFIGSSNVQVFGMGHQGTLNWVAAAIGGDKEASSGNYPLMRPDEIREFLGKDAPTQIVIPATGLPMRLERVAFQRLKSYRGMDD